MVHAQVNVRSTRGEAEVPGVHRSQSQREGEKTDAERTQFWEKAEEGTERHF